MAVGFSGIASSNVTVTGAIQSLPIPTSTAVAHTVVFTSTGGTLTTAYTVPAGKTFHLMAVSLQRSASEVHYLYQNDGTTLIWSGNTLTTMNYVQYSPNCVIHSFTEGQLVRIQSQTSACKWTLTGLLVTN